MERTGICAFRLKARGDYLQTLYTQNHTMWDEEFKGAVFQGVHKCFINCPTS